MNVSNITQSVSSTRASRLRVVPTLVFLLVALSGCLSQTKSDVAAGADVTVSISASPTSVSSGEMSTLTWSSSNADSCSASGAWSGVRPSGGTEDVGPLSADSEFTLTCTGTGADAVSSTTITVTAAPTAPSLTFAASPAVVSQGASSVLTWSTTNADSCTASGDWSGVKSTSGSEATANLMSSASFSLNCSGPGGSVSRTVSVDVTASTGDGIFGAVDSSLINRTGTNLVYLYQGSVTPDDFDGDSGDPIATAVVQQDPGACTFSYDSGSLVAGDYTVAFTSAGENDNPQTSDNIEFFGVQNVSLAAAPLAVGFEAASVIRVGPGRTYSTVSAAANAAQDGDVIEIDAGVYAADVATWYQDNLTLRGVGGYAHLRADGADAQGKAIWVIEGNNTIVENIEFSEITVPDQNGAGIRADGRDLVVCNGYFHDSDEGILGGAGEVLIEYSEFADNGFGDGFSHNMYILDADRFTLRYSYMHHARIGHNVKTRARENYILFNRVMDEMTGNASYAVDIPNGGLSYVIGNLLQQGPNTDNSAIVNYGTEGLLGGRTHNLYVVNNTFVDDFGGIFIQAAGGSSLVRTINNLFVGSGTVVSGITANATTNLQTTGPALVDIDSYDYRLTAASPARDSGSDPGSGDGFDMNPRFQYLHKSNEEERPADATIDIGAYEFTP